MDYEEIQLMRKPTRRIIDWIQAEKKTVLAVDHKLVLNDAVAGRERRWTVYCSRWCWLSVWENLQKWSGNIDQLRCIRSGAGDTS